MNEYIKEIEKIAKKCTISQSDGYSQIMRICEAIFENQTEHCEWIKYDYRTLCPREHDINNPYWRIPVDRTKLAYCPYCGKKIKIVD